MRRSAWILALAASVPSFAAEPTPLSNSVPPDAALYAAWVGAEGFGPAFAGSDLARALATPETKEAVATFFAELPKMFAYDKGAPDPAAGAVFVRVLRDRPGAVFLRRASNGPEKKR